MLLIANAYEQYSNTNYYMHTYMLKDVFYVDAIRYFSMCFLCWFKLSGFAAIRTVPRYQHLALRFDFSTFHGLAEER